VEEGPAGDHDAYGDCTSALQVGEGANAAHAWALVDRTATRIFGRLEFKMPALLTGASSRRKKARKKKQHTHIMATVGFCVRGEQGATHMNVAN
jgi:hypothetical protein